MGVTARDMNSCVSRAMGAAPLKQNLKRPPVASFTLLKTIESSKELPGSPLAMRNLTPSVLRSFDAGRRTFSY
jgi:hypothetical protein